MKISRKTGIIVSGIIVCLLAVWLCYEISWRFYGTNTITIEVEKGLDMNKTEVIWEHYMGGETIIKKGKRIKDFDQVPATWLVVYANLSGYCTGSDERVDDNRRKFDYKFKFFSKKGSIFCECWQGKDHQTIELTN